MKLVIQRVESAHVNAEGNTISSIGKGLLVLLGVGEGATKDMADKYVDKLIKLRIFEDDKGKTNLNRG